MKQCHGTCDCLEEKTVPVEIRKEPDVEEIGWFCKQLGVWFIEPKAWGICMDPDDMGSCF